MQIVQNKEGKKILSIVCCLHGDEMFGLEVFEYFKNRINDYPGLKIILANEEAMAENKRFIETDLNRSFPGKIDGSHEECLAQNILGELKEFKYVLDIHTTTSNIIFTPIVSNLNDNTKRILNLCSSKELVLMPEKFSQASLIGQLAAGVSLEFNFDYAKQNRAMMEVVNISGSLLKNKTKPKILRKIFYIDSIIDKTIMLSRTAKNFDFIESLASYPFLLNEKSYKDNQGFFAKQTEEIYL